MADCKTIMLHDVSVLSCVYCPRWQSKTGRTK